MPDMPEGAQLSEDGQWWWDGTEWQQVLADQAASEREVTGEDLMVYNDTGAEAGDDSQLREEHKPYFQSDGDTVPDDYSSAECDSSIDESQYQASTEGDQ